MPLAQAREKRLDTVERVSQIHVVGHCIHAEGFDHAWALIVREDKDCSADGRHPLRRKPRCRQRILYRLG